MLSLGKIRKEAHNEGLISRRDIDLLWLWCWGRLAHQVNPGPTIVHTHLKVGLIVNLLAGPPRGCCTFYHFLEC
jgi:hypothetical protein